MKLGLYQTRLGTPSSSVVYPLPGLQARDRFRSERQEGGDNVTSHLVPLAPATLDEGDYEGYNASVRDNADGTYDLSYVPELAG